MTAEARTLARASRRARWLAMGVVSSLAMTGYFADGRQSHPRVTEIPVEASPTEAPPVEAPPVEAPPAEVPAPLPPAPPPATECFPGVVLANESMDVVTEIAGRIREVLVRPGDAVERGTPLAFLDNEDLGHQVMIERGNLARVTAEVKNFTAQLERADRRHRRRLALQGLLSREETEGSAVELEVARFRLEVARAELMQAEARGAQLATHLEHLKIRAPFPGTIAMCYLNRGVVTTPGTPVVRMISANASRVRFAVPQTAAGAPPVGARVRVEIETLEQSALGVVEHRAPEVDDASEMIFVEARLDSGGPPIPPGAMARVSLLTAGTEAPGGPRPPWALPSWYGTCFSGRRPDE